MEAGVAEGWSGSSEYVVGLPPDAKLAGAEGVPEVAHGGDRAMSEAGEGAGADGRLRFHEVVPAGVEQLVPVLSGFAIGGYDGFHE